MSLSLEQQFAVTSFETQIQGLSREQALKMLVDLYRQQLQRENAYKELIKAEWEVVPVSPEQKTDVQVEELCDPLDLLDPGIP